MKHLTRCGTALALLAALLGGLGAGAVARPSSPPAGQAVVEPVAGSGFPAQVVVDGVTLSPAYGPVGRPTQLQIPAIGVREPLHAVGLLADGAMETPDFGDAGWYEPGPRPGAPGPAVVVAHVHGPAGDDVFARLHELERGDAVTVRRTDGASTFVVDTVEQAPKDALPHERIWGRSDVPVLRLITCGGTPDPETRMYPDNTIVYAHLAP